jgi:hypothetical protein
MSCVDKLETIRRGLNVLKKYGLDPVPKIRKMMLKLGCQVHGSSSDRSVLNICLSAPLRGLVKAVLCSFVPECL